MEESEILDERKKKFWNFLKKNYNWISYVILAILVYVAVKIRTSNLAGLKDITTGDWTLGPDLDPFLFLRWAQEIVQTGHLAAMDMLRYVPIGFKTSEELWLHPFMIAWFHKIATFFGSSSVTLSANLYPAFMFGFAMITFFLMTRLIFLESLGGLKANLIALISTFFLSIFPVLVPRTIAGIPEKEAGGLPFLFLAFYFFIWAWKSERVGKKYLLATLAGISTGIMAMIWGGYIYITTSIALAVLVAFVFGKVKGKNAIAYFIWLALPVIMLLGLTERVTFVGLLASTSFSPVIFVLLTLVADYALFGTKIKKYLERSRLFNLPRPFVSFIVAIVVGIILISVLLGPGFLFNKIVGLKNQLVTPVADRLGVTVAENRQPFFSEWESNFGPHVKEIALTFWLFFVGSIYLVYFALREFKKERWALTAAYTFFLACIVFSRYDASSTLNGTNMISLFVYALGPIALLVIGGYYYFKDRETFSKIDFEFVFLISFFVISLLSARSAVRLIMMLAPSAAIIIGYFAVVPLSKAKHTKDSFWRTVWWVVALAVILITLLSAYRLYNETSSMAQVYVPSIYTQQWQKVMAWVRNETPTNAVFGHWWDYGYWVQTMGERATVLDGGNYLPYWNHMMGRYALTGTNETEALEFLYAHNTTHFLIDSTDIGKYSAFSSIGSDINYDRASYIVTMLKDNTQTQEKKSSTLFVYAGGIALDGDVVYEMNGTKIFLPAGRAGLAAVVLEEDKNRKIVTNPLGVFVYDNKQYMIPMRYAYDGELRDFNNGINAGIFLMPRVDQQGNNVQVDQDGALLYLSDRTVMSQLARLYLYKLPDENFKLVHNEDDFVVDSLKAQGVAVKNDLVYFNGVRGPIRIWEINYPKNIAFDQRYLDTDYPEELARV